MKQLIYLIFILLSFGQLERISFFNQQINIYLHEVLMGLFVIGGIREIRRIRGIRGIRSFAGSIVFFLGVLHLSLVFDFWKFSLYENFLGFSYWLRLVLYFAFFGVLLEWGNREILRKGINVFTWLTIVISTLQYFLYPNLRNLYYLGWDPHQYRIFGTLFDPTILGIIFVLLFFYTVWEIWAVREVREVGEIRKIEMLKIVSLFVLILFTYSRIAYLSFLIALIYYFFGKVKTYKIAAFILAFLLLLFILPRPSGHGVRLERTFSIAARMKDMKEGISLWREHPAFGVGFNRIRFYKNTASDSHAGAGFSSSFVTLLATSGIIGIIGGFWMVRELWVYAERAGKTLILILTASSLFDNIFFNIFSLLTFLVTFAVVNLHSRNKQ